MFRTKVTETIKTRIFFKNVYSENHVLY